MEYFKLSNEKEFNMVGGEKNSRDELRIIVPDIPLTEIDKMKTEFTREALQTIVVYTGNEEEIRVYEGYVNVDYEVSGLIKGGAETKANVCFIFTRDFDLRDRFLTMEENLKNVSAKVNETGKKGEENKNSIEEITEEVAISKKAVEESFNKNSDDIENIKNEMEATQEVIDMIIMGDISL